MSKTMQHHLRQTALKHWPALVAFGLLFIALAAMLLFRLQTLLPGYSASEVVTYHIADSLKTIWNQPTNAPYEIIVHGLRYAAPHNLVVVRLASALIGGITLVVFCILMLRWHGSRAAIMGTLLFGMSAWFLHVARLGSPEAMFLLLLPLVACGVWLREKQSGLAAILGLTLCSILLYTPGMAWFLVVGLVLQWPTVDKVFKKNPGSVALGSALFLAILAPLIWHFTKHPHDITTWLCLPTSWAHPLHFIRTIIDVPLAIFYRTPSENPLAWIGRLPVLSVFSTVMFLAGCYVYAKKVRLARVRLLMLLGIFGTIIIGLSQGRIPLTPILPFIFIVITAGLGYVIDSWYEVFPRNPIAQGLGLGLAICVLLLACVYNTRNYFVAWPQATVTRALFTTKEP